MLKKIMSINIEPILTLYISSLHFSPVAVLYTLYCTKMGVLVALAKLQK